MSLLDKFESLNQTDLSALIARLAAIRADMERELSIKTTGAKPTPTAATAPVAGRSPSVSDGLTVEQLINELAQAKRSAA